MGQREAGQAERREDHRLEHGVRLGVGDVLDRADRTIAGVG